MEEQNSQKQNFLKDTDFLTLLITDELKQYGQVLVGAKGLYAASNEVELSEWNTFIDSQNLPTRFPGLQGVGYVEHTLHENRDKLIAKMVDYGFVNYQILPQGDRSEYYPVLFVAPLDIRNEKAIGFDIYSEQIRQDAVNLLKKTGDTTITGKIILVQEIDDDIQYGFLMLTPIYSNEANSSDTLTGMVYAVFRINDFILGTVDGHLFDNIKLKIYDTSVSDENLFFDSQELHDTTFDDDFSTEIFVSINNRDWVFSYAGNSVPLNLVEALVQIFIPVVGIAMSLLLFYMFRIFATNIKLTQEAANSEKITTIGTMASRMSHDLKNPLTVIKSSLELLKMNLGPDLDEKTKNYTKRIDDSIDSIFSIIDDVLEFAKNSKLHKEKTSINFLLETVVSNIDVPKDIQIKLPENKMTLNCDSSKMKSVFSNLITNSIQSIENNGTITISIESDSKNAFISIVDSGPGIPKDKISRIFDPLFTTKSSGTGLGLGICRNIIEQHRGTISVHNNPTTFTISLPKTLASDDDNVVDAGVVLKKMLKDIKKDET
ncbi:CHASE domain-containing protein [Nitrosopumilus oxyclinae]|uniref:CHASE domain-containing protein n=1 Tax=Nitrosopumilus oxyclinae TaxID=1959104 RepID=UPI001FE7BB76|nr:CHASE domain-containing protein [Nitrosopumilus oxyclinae]